MDAIPFAPAASDTRPADAPSAAQAVRPLGSGERILSIDVIRGFAVLGILLMNIVGFGLHAAAYADPTVAGGADGVNLWVYALILVLVDGKMRGIFSLVFGAGVVVLMGRLFERGAGAEAADVHYRRMFWLMLFGVVHAYLLWWGDILYPYALLGLLLYPLRRLSPRALFITAVVLALLLTGVFTGEAYRAIGVRDEAAAADAAAAAGATLTEEQIDAQRAWRERLKNAKPDAAELARVNAAFTGSFGEMFMERAKLVAQFHFTPYYFPLLWDMLVMMLAGMALAKTGALAAARSYRYYAWMAAAGYGIGLPLHLWMLQRSLATGFEHIAVGFTGILYEPARIAVCFGHIAVLMIVLKAGVLRRVTATLAAVGQMAFTNYIVQSIICSTIFYGYGFALFGKLQRFELYYVVVGCWVVNVAMSRWWLRRYRFGPLEWGWRSLTYWRRQPMRT